ncbi:MAG: ribokinase [Rhodobacter sp. BACL10 MAG-120910-bin24]|jgi:ribokinase|nr:MAG: ribokinase [Rhodobacter sp. BACL10 MAG-120910-bin24]KRP25254.1 MAG: ribokinase [Rhodobacter sp. BACL10 MAG-120419-bin15]|tara:strand:- start:40 stop:975 length:936 start_codon:yes stop_codon:yes gene_type:complete
MQNVVFLGIFVADAAYVAPSLPNIGETVLGSRFILGPGGKGSNQAVACAKNGVKTSIITRLGKDDFANLAFNTWKEANVISLATQDESSYTGSAFIFVQEGTGQNAVLVSPGAASLITIQDIIDHSPDIEQASVFVTNFEVPIKAVEYSLNLARRAKVTTILNPAPAADFPAGLLSLCDYVTPNESEAEAITGLPVRSIEDAILAAHKLVELGAGASVVTLGASGVVYYKNGKTLLVPAHAPAKVIDTTGAGDAFNGGFAAALAKGLSDEEALVYGSATAGISVTRMGTAPSMPVSSEVETFVSSFELKEL